jgi:CHAT domain-containing protein
MIGIVLWLVLGHMFSPCSMAAVGTDRRSVPGPMYQAAFSSFYDGEYDDALKVYQDQWRGAIKTIQSRWIDSICYYTMIGECYYHMGQLDLALEQYTEALRLFLVFPDWMLRVQFPPTIQPDSNSNFRPIPWGVSKRNAPIGHFPSTMLIGQGQIDISREVREGGVVQAPVLFGINVQEIVRCTALAIRRRTELLGPIAPHDPLTAELINMLSRRPAPPNHWSQCWVEAELALALLAGGKTAEAIPLLNRSMLAAGQYDHPLTSVVLFELGRLAMLQSNYPEAIKQFEEAGYSAARFDDYGMLEESLRYAAMTHLLSNRGGFYAPLVPANEWANVKRWRQLQASLLLSGAENYLVLHQESQALTTLDEAQATLGRRAMGNGALGCRLNYLRALACFQQRKIPAGNGALAAAMNYMQHGSHWLMQIRLIDRQFTAGQMGPRGSITARTAMELFTDLLRDPQPSDWALDPMESMAVLLTPHSEPLEHWFLIALERKEFETAIEIADRARRQRFYSSLPLGGRLLSLQWILEAPDATLDAVALQQRQNLLAGYPEYGQLAQQAQQLRKSLEAMPLVPEGESLRQQEEALKKLGQISLQQEGILHEIALRREPAEMAFPPLRTTKEIQASLPQGTALLVFFSAGGDLYGFLVNNEKYGYWRLKGGNTLSKRVTTLLHDIGQYEANRELTLKELSEAAWKDTAKRLLDDILQGSQADFTQNFPELVIVPDGVLWYLPFEMLEVKVGDKLLPLISRIRMRYAPTASLAVSNGRQLNPVARTAVVLGRLYPRQEETVARAAFDEISKAVPGSVALSGPTLPAASSLYGSLVEQLLVLDDIASTEGGPYGWSPLPIDRGKPGSLLTDWLALPWGGPSVVILPGFHMASEGALKHIDTSAPGREVFLSVCGLMASGARTILISRWRTGGQTSVDLVREFAQELPHTTPAEAWQRAVLLAASTRINPAAEPRIKSSPNDDPPKGTHPFFWAGYMLIDPGIAAEGNPDQPGQPGLQLMEPGQPAPVPEPKAVEDAAEDRKATENGDAAEDGDAAENKEPEAPAKASKKPRKRAAAKQERIKAEESVKAEP